MIHLVLLTNFCLVSEAHQSFRFPSSSYCRPCYYQCLAFDSKLIMHSFKQYVVHDFLHLSSLSQPHLIIKAVCNFMPYDESNAPKVEIVWPVL